MSFPQHAFLVPIHTGRAAVLMVVLRNVSSILSSGPLLWGEVLPHSMKQNKVMFALGFFQNTYDRCPMELVRCIRHILYKSVAKQRGSVCLNYLLCWKMHSYLSQLPLTTAAVYVQARFIQFSSHVRLGAKHNTILLELNGIDAMGLSPRSSSYKLCDLKQGSSVFGLLMVPASSHSC